MFQNKIMIRELHTIDHFEFKNSNLHTKKVTSCGHIDLKVIIVDLFRENARDCSSNTVASFSYSLSGDIQSPKVRYAQIFIEI